MTDVDDYWEPGDDREPDYDDDDPQAGYEPDPEDSEIARGYEEYAEHCETVHGGGECTCRPTLADRLRDAAREKGYAALNAWYRAKDAARHPLTLRVGPAELTVRLHAGRTCGACSGRGWFYTLDRSREDDRPPGHNGTALCGCGSAIGRLPDTRHYLRSTRNEPPF